VHGEYATGCWCCFDDKRAGWLLEPPRQTSSFNLAVLYSAPRICGLTGHWIGRAEVDCEYYGMYGQ